MEIRILNRSEVGSIDPDSWDRLADSACVPNPFYERWHLLSALEYLDLEDEVLVVTAYREDRLVCLFPVVMQRKALLFRYIALWHFCDCLASDVLREPGVTFGPILKEVMDRLQATVVISPAHVEAGFDVDPDFSYCRTRKPRRAVTQFTSWENYLQRLPRKYRKESKRILSRLIEKEGVRYVTSEKELSSKWFPLYCEIEDQSWKAKDGRLLSAEKESIHYYEKALERGEVQKKVEFQALLKGDEVIAISFRFKTGRKAFEVKTSYNNDYKSLYPGVVLELLNIRNVLDADYSLVDSCGWHNQVVERIWPDRIDVYRTVIFRCSIPGQIAKLVYRFVKRLRMSSNPVDLTCNRISR
jgi:hypothetical protein